MCTGCYHQQLLIIYKILFMGKIKSGILGGFIGKVGTVIGSNWRGVQYMRGLSTKKRGTATSKQLEQQARFKLAVRFLRPLRNLLSLTFKGSAFEMTERNVALSLTLAEAVTGAYPDFRIDPSKVLVSKGSLENVDAPTATAAAGGTINFAWMDNSGQLDAQASDRAVLVAYNVATRKASFASGTSQRNSGNGALVTPQFSGQTVHTWIAFMSESGKDVSDSIYTGEITLP
jgi:hypothetical protein